MTEMIPMPREDGEVVAPDEGEENLTEGQRIRQKGGEEAENEVLQKSLPHNERRE